MKQVGKNELIHGRVWPPRALWRRGAFISRVTVGLGQGGTAESTILPNSHYYKSVFKPAKIEPLGEESF
jgi:hypothetical protein